MPLPPPSKKTSEKTFFEIIMANKPVKKWISPNQNVLIYVTAIAGKQ